MNPLIARLFIFALSIVPVLERGAIPTGILSFGLSPAEAFLWSVAGNVVPILIVYAVADAWVRFVEKRKGILHKITHAIFSRVRRHAHNNYDQYGVIALLLLVSIPIPFTGAWTGAAAAYLFNVPLKKAFPPLFIGICISALIITLATTGAVDAFRAFL